MSLFRPSLVAVAFTISPALADAPRVMTDIAPVHSLVSMVMGQVGAPDLLIPAGSSPHDFSLRPSDARHLQDAGLIVWIGEDLTPWLTRPLNAMAADASVLSLMDSPSTVLRVGGHDHDDHGAHDDHDDHGAHDDHDDHGAHDDHDDHDEHDDHDAHDEEHHEDTHEGDNHDPHVWLDPVNAATWLPQIAEALAALDTENAALYHANAQAAALEIGALIEELDHANLSDARFIVSHDAFGYFEDRFDAHALGSIAQSDAAAPGPARVAALRDAAALANVHCVLVEPQFNAGLAEAVVPDGLILGEIDAMGVKFDLGASLYPDVMRAIAAAIVSCTDG